MIKRDRHYPVDTGRKLNVHKRFRRRPERLLNDLYAFNLRLVSTGYKCDIYYKVRCNISPVSLKFRLKEVTSCCETLKKPKTALK